MEPQIIDYYNEMPSGVNVIEKMNEEFSILQKENDELKKKLKIKLKINETLKELANSKTVLLAHQSRPGSKDFISLSSHTDLLKKHINNKIDVKNFMNSVYSPIGFHIKYFTLFESSVVENKIHYKIIEKFNLT